MYLHDSKMQLYGSGCLKFRLRMHTICLTDPPYQAKIMPKFNFCVPLTSIQLEFSTTYTANNDRQDTIYATIPMMICDE